MPYEDVLQRSLQENILYQLRMQKMWLRRIYFALLSLLLVLVVLTLVSIRAEWLNEQPFDPDSEATAQRVAL